MNFPKYLSLMKRKSDQFTSYFVHIGGGGVTLKALQTNFAYLFHQVFINHSQFSLTLARAQQMY